VNYSIEYAPLFGALERIDVRGLAGAVSEAWWNRTLVDVDGTLVRLGVMHGEYHWHRHQREDEFFLVLEGRLVIELADRPSAELSAGHAFVVPAGLPHRPVAAERSTVLMLERAGVVATGD
jgi:mannose-6-phosphate isomerase-like protein (cupin superfamily)